MTSSGQRPGSQAPETGEVQNSSYALSARVNYCRCQITFALRVEVAGPERWPGICLPLPNRLDWAPQALPARERPTAQVPATTNIFRSPLPRHVSKASSTQAVVRLRGSQSRRSSGLFARIQRRDLAICGSPCAVGAWLRHVRKAQESTDCGSACARPPGLRLRSVLSVAIAPRCLVLRDIGLR